MGEMDTTAGGTSQRRAFPRIPLRAKVRMEFAEQRCFLAEWAVNLSPGGMFVRSEASLAPGQRFEFEANLARKGPRFCGKGQVLWVRRQWDGNTRPPGFAVRFTEIEEGGRRAIERLAEVFLGQGVTAMQQELAGMSEAWQRRALEEESTGEIPVITAADLAPPPTQAIATQWGSGDEEDTATHSQEDLTGGGEVQPAADGDGSATGIASAPEEPGSQASSAEANRPGARRRSWWVGALMLVGGAVALLVLRNSFATRGAAIDAAVAVPVRGAAVARVASPRPAGARPVVAAAPTTEVLAIPARASLPVETAAPTLRPLPVLRAVRWHAEAGGLDVLLAFDSDLDAVVHRFRPAQEPPREVIQLAGARLGDVPPVTLVAEPLLQQVRVGFHPGDAVDEVRVVLDLASDEVRLGDVSVEGAILRLRLENAAAPAETAASEGTTAATPAPVF